MEYLISGRKPEALFRFFEEISAIPRGSGNEKAIADYIEHFAVSRQLFCVRDKENNVFVRKNGSEGRENEPALLLQGHTDMVCEKNMDISHDFEKDPIRLILENGWLRADGTTLGADDGVAVATMLAVLDGAMKSHPPIECLFTTGEEVGLDGAKAFDYSLVSARRMINLDSEQEGYATVSCAGGVRTDLSLPMTKLPFAGEALEITLSGLAGGHSGAEIHLGRANANKLMGRLLYALCQTTKLHLALLTGGSKDNAIPRESRAVIAVEPCDCAKVIEKVAHMAAVFAAELCEEDRGMKLVCRPTEKPSDMMDLATTQTAVAIPVVVANGVLAMSRDIEGLVEYSRNLGVIQTSEKHVDYVFSSRSSVESRIDSSEEELSALAAVTGCLCRHYSRYPGWQYEKVSSLRDRYAEVAPRVFGKTPVIEAIHAGLECGIIKSHIPDMDMISIGPDMKGIHSPDEKLELASCERLWVLLEQMMQA